MLEAHDKFAEMNYIAFNRTILQQPTHEANTPMNNKRPLKNVKTKM